MADDFTVFQDTFRKYQRLFGLTGYRVVFKHEPLHGNLAEIEGDETGRLAIVRMTSEPGEHAVVASDPPADAKHEAIHLLLNRLLTQARARFISQAEITEALEELVVKLESLIPDVT